MLLSGYWTIDLAAVASVLFGIFYYYFTCTHDHWKKLNVPYATPTFPFGNFGKVFAGKATFVQVLQDHYPLTKKTGYAGVYHMRGPLLLVSNPEMIKHILTKDFSSFHDRGMPFDEKNDPFSAHLFNLEGQRWKNLRAKLSPTFTSGKIKGMFPLIHECSQELERCIRKAIHEKKGSVEMKDLLIRYTTDVIGSCAFGINCNSLSDPDAQFHRMGREIFQFNIKNTIRNIFVGLYPKMAKYLTLQRLFPKTTEFFTTLMERTVDYRKTNNVERNDFVQLMMKIMDDESNEEPFTPGIMTAQALLFFIAGLENVAHTIGFSLHHLALDPELQERVNEEIERVLKEYDGKINYEAIGKMDLLARVLDESLRMYTPAGMLFRNQNEETFILPGTDVELKKGCKIMMPIQAMHCDEEYFPDPQKFDPDRFTEEEKAKRHPYVYLPFGEGPRFCIASRFAHLEMRLSFAELIKNFKFSVAPETVHPIELDMKSFAPSPKGGFWLRIEERSSL